jgi:PAS domain S-box-containing protein
MNEIAALAAEALPLGVAVTDLYGFIIWANPAYARLMGCVPDELPGRSGGEFPFDELLHSAPAPEPWREETLCRRKTGDSYTARHSITILRNSTGEATGFCITKEDITGLRPQRGPLQAEANLSALIESTEDLIVSVDLEYRLLTFNQALRDSIKATVGLEAAVGMRPEEWLPPGRWTLWPPMFDRALSEGPFRTEYTLLDGRTLELSFNPICQGNRKVGVSVFGKDLTDWKATEKTLRKAEETYRNIYEGALEGMFRTTLEGKGLAANPALAKMLGYDSPEDALAAITDSAHQVWMNPHERANCLRLVEKHEAVHGYECQFKRKDGTAVWVALSIRKVRGPDRSTAYYEGFVADITERKRAAAAIEQANRAIAEAERHYRLMFNSVSDAVFVYKVGEDGLPTRFIEVNDRACRHLGYAREELQRLGPYDILAPEDRSAIQARVQRIRADRHLIWEGTLLAKDGRRIPVEVHGHLVDLDGSETIISSVRDISDRKKAEQQYREIFDGAVEGIHRTSSDGTSLAANPALARMLGYDSVQEFMSAVTNWTTQIWLNPDDRLHFLRLLQDEGVVRGYECQLKRKDGTAIWVSMNSRKVCGPDGRMQYSDGFIEDITERERMHDALRRSEIKFSKVFRCNPAVTILCAPENEGSLIAEVNEAFEHRSGYRREEVIGRTTKELGLWADARDYDQFRNRFRAQGSVRNFEHGFRRKTGDCGFGLTSAELIELDGKSFILSATIDITEQKKIEETMRSLITAIEQAGETIVITDLDGTIQYCNPAFEKTSGYSKEEAVGQNTKLLKSGKHGKDFYKRMWGTITEGKVWSGPMTNRKKDGSLYQEDATISPIRDVAGKISGFVAIKRDVTQQLQLEGQLRQAQKMESVGRLAGGVAHDFNNLLTIINGYSSFLLNRLKVGDPLRAYADEIRMAGDRAASLTKQLLAFSRKQVIEPKVLDLNATIRESAPMLQRLIGEDIVLETHLDSSAGQVMADPDQIHQVIMNLAVNARDAMPAGGAIDVETENVELGEELSGAGHLSAAPGRYVLMTVTDNGQGMDEPTRQQIFEPFFTTKELGKGTGLGLATVYGIVRQSGGWIDVWSEVGVGTSFKVYLPRIDSCPLPERQGTSAPTERGFETILVVEDQTAVRAYTGAVLNQCGYRVLEASDGHEATAAAERHAGEIHLLLTDVVMPGMNGKELSERLKVKHPNLKVLFISGYTADAIAHHGVLDPGVALLHKPFCPEELAGRIREILARPSATRP